MPNAKKPTSNNTFISPWRNLIILSVLIVAAEATLMLILSFFPKYSLATHIGILIIMLSPALYLFVFKPLLLLLTQHKQIANELALKNKIAHIFLTVPDDEMYAEVLRIVLDTMKSKYGAFGYIDNDTGALVTPSLTREVWDHCQMSDKDPVLPKNIWGGTWGQALTEKKTVYSNKPGHVPKGHIPITRSLAVPIIYQEEVIGLLKVANKETDYDDNDQALLEAIATDTAPILYARLQKDRQEKERKQAEEELRASEEKFRNIFDNVNIMIWGCYADGKIKIFNKEAERVMGYSQKEVLGKENMLLHPPEEREEIIDKFSRHKDGELKKYLELGVYTKEGKRLKTLLAQATFKDTSGKDFYVALMQDITERKLAEKELDKYRQHLEELVEERTAELAKVNKELIQDITERKQVENALRESEERYRTLFDHAADSVVLIDAESGALVEFNDIAYENLCYTCEEFQQLKIADFEIIESPEEVARHMKKVTEEGFDIFETKHITKDGEIRDVIVSARAIAIHGKDFLLSTYHDFTEHKQLEEKLKEFKFISDNANDAHLLLGRDAKFKYVNKTTCEMMGYSEEELLTLGVPDVDIVYDVARYQELFDLIQEEAIPPIETIVKRKDSTTFPAEITVTGYKIDGEHYIFSALRDITERKQTEEVLRFQGEITNNMSEGINLVRTKDVTIIYTNPKFDEIFGYERGELMGKNISIVNAPTEKSPEITAREIMDCLNKNGTWEGEIYNIKKDGTKFWCYVSVSTFQHYDYGEVWISIHTDITERKRAEETLLLEKQKLDNISNYANCGLLLLDKESRVTYANKFAEKWFGPLAQFEGKFCYEVFKMKHPERDCTGLKVLKTGSTVRSDTFTEILAGEKRFFYVVGSPVKDRYGKVNQVIELVVDITERKQAEYELKARQREIEELNANLEQRVQEELEKSHQKDILMMHQSRLAAMGEMIGLIAHQWRQPLNALDLLLYNIKDMFANDELDETELDDLTENGMKLIDKMSTTIDDFRNFFKPDKKQEVFSVNQIVKETLFLLDASHSYHEISVTINDTGELHIVGFANEYSQVILNILNNARDAILISGVKGKITIDISQGKNCATVTIQDNGAGIPEDIIDVLFDPYFTTKTQAKGTGLGLHLAKMIIEEHMNGSITVKNIDGGAEFKISTPMLEDTPPSPLEAN